MSWESSTREIQRYAEWALKEAGVSNRLPTPIDEIVSCANLAVSKDISLNEIHQGFFAKAFGVLRSALSKLRAIVDFRDNLIYLDVSLPPKKINWAKLHECGHAILPWQRKAYFYEDDERTLSPDVQEQFEREANVFAAEVMFQVVRFTKEAADLPLSIKSPIELSKRYGASCHSAIRRYVETHHVPCAVIVCQCSNGRADDTGRLLVQHHIYSVPFVQQRGRVQVPPVLDENHPWAQLVLDKKIRLIDSGQMNLVDGNGDMFPVNFHIFNNTYNVFIFIFPSGVSKRGWRRIFAA